MAILLVWMDFSRYDAYYYYLPINASVVLYFDTPSALYSYSNVQMVTNGILKSNSAEVR